MSKRFGIGAGAATECLIAADRGLRQAMHEIDVEGVEAERIKQRTSRGRS
jgi:hypothetical protein